MAALGRLLLLCSCACLLLQAQLARADVKSALQSLKTSIDPENTLGWDSNQDHCGWSGVSCSNGQVTSM